MEERNRTIEGETTRCRAPSSCWRPQNPVELEGTFPLPEAQLDRFLMRLKLGYPDEAERGRDPRALRESSPLDDTCP